MGRVGETHAASTTFCSLSMICLEQRTSRSTPRVYCIPVVVWPMLLLHGSWDYVNQTNS